MGWTNLQNGVQLWPIAGREKGRIHQCDEWSRSIGGRMNNVDTGESQMNFLKLLKRFKGLGFFLDFRNLARILTGAGTGKNKKGLTTNEVQLSPTVQNTAIHCASERSARWTRFWLKETIWAFCMRRYSFDCVRSSFYELHAVKIGVLCTSWRRKFSK